MTFLYSLFRAAKSFHLRLKLNNWSIYKFLPFEIFYLGKVSEKDSLKWDKLRKEVGFRCWQHIHPPLRRTYKWEACIVYRYYKSIFEQKMNNNDSSYVQKSSTQKKMLSQSVFLLFACSTRYDSAWANKMVIDRSPIYWRFELVIHLHQLWRSILMFCYVQVF